VHGPDVADPAAISEQLQSTLNSRVVLEQAKGLVAQLGDLDMDQAFGALRRYARDHDQRLAAIAPTVVSRELPAQRLIGHAQTQAVRRPSSAG